MTTVSKYEVYVGDEKQSKTPLTHVYYLRDWFHAERTQTQQFRLFSVRAVYFEILALSRARATF